MSVMDIGQFREALAKKGVETASCPVCGSNAWAGMDDVVRLPVEYAPLRRGLVRDSIRVIPATCGRCGYIQLHSPEVLLSE